MKFPAMDVTMSNLSHHGIKGMRWGVRRENVGKAGEKVVSTDAARAKAASQKIKKSGVHSLSNEELQTLVTRMNLEQSLSRLNTSEPKSPTKKFIADTLANVAKQQITKIANDVVAKQVGVALGKKSK